MNWLVLIACLYFAGCQAASADSSASVNFPETKNKEKGFLEWVTNLIGGNTTPNPVITAPEPIEKDCPVCQCGVATTKRRIVGGHETLVNQFPWMAMLLYNGRFFCGGALITDLHVMTAAHCTGLRKDRMTVRLLEHDITNKNKSKIIDRKIARVIRHQRYNPGTYDNDIALLKLDERVDLSNAIKKRSRDTDDASTTEAEATTQAEATTTSTEATTEEDIAAVRPVCLASPGLSYTDHCGLAIGWGVTEQGGTTSPTLQEVKVPIVSNKECQERSYGKRVTDNMICAGYPEGGRDACQGDSGGPLHAVNATSGLHEIVGVVSWGEGCAVPNKYGVYTRVNRYLTWIKSNTADGCYCN